MTEKQREPEHKMRVTTNQCDCEANDCHGHTVPVLSCGCGYREETIFSQIPKLVRKHCPDFTAYKQTMLDTEYPS